MNRRLGWWEFDPAGPGMVHSLTGERVVYRGALGGRMRVTWSENWLRYDYVHSDLTFPLVARIVQTPHGVRDEVRFECLSVDYPRSARLWRDDPFGSRVVGTAPAYGVWRRVDDCLTDAFGCWPRHETGGWRGGGVELVGGWLNGVWRPDFARISDAGAEPWLRPDGIPDGRPPRAAPALIDMAARPEPRWTVVGPGAEGALLKTQDGRLELQAPEASEGPQQSAALFTLVDHEGGTRRTVVAQAAAHPAQWNVELVSSTASAPLDYNAWLACHWAIIDAFGAWRSAGATSGDGGMATDLRPPDAIRLASGFRGGYWLPSARCHVFYAR